MIPLLAGAGLLLLLLGAADVFARARVPTIKALVGWVAALGGLSLALLLVLSGRWPAAFWALGMLGPLAWNQWRGSARPGPRGSQTGAAGPRAGGRGGAAGGGAAGGGAAGGTLTRAEAWAVLGLAPGASAAEIRDAHRRLMRVSHPDNGGSDWVAARVNQARDILLQNGGQTRGPRQS
jgi:hypothetical protein